MLKHAGITDVAINVHHLAAEVEHALGDGSAIGIRITYSPERVLAGTGGPLAVLRDYFGDEPFVLLNCDTILDLDLTRMIDFHCERGGLATFVLRGGGDPDAYSRIECDDHGRIGRMRLLHGRTRGEFVDYPAGLDASVAARLTPFMYCGVMICEPEVFTMTPVKPPFSLMGDLFAPIAARGVPLFGYIQSGFFRTIDDLAGYEAVRHEFGTTPPPLDYLR
jgi:mannose-1-phosphate guanylyltransferase/phosphomannomutase